MRVEFEGPAMRRAKAAGRLAAAGALWVAFAAAAEAASPQIRTSARNAVPACATPARLLDFTRERNPALARRYGELARHYARHGRALRVRWDYAYFQMLLETNYLTFRRPDGSPGDVSPRQNNLAGLGATGGGVPGDSFPSLSSGVKAQLQHLVVYSGERVADPVAPRTRLKMDEILARSASLGRPVTFQDLSGRWAADRSYGSSIESIAQSFRITHCREMAASTPPAGRSSLLGRWLDRPVLQRSLKDDEGPAARPARPGPRKPLTRVAKVAPPPHTAPLADRPAAPRPAASVTAPAKPAPPPAREPAAPIAPPPAAAPPPQASPAPSAAPVPVAPVTVTPCKVFRASYGGPGALLIEARDERLARYTVLEVQAGQEAAQAKAFIEAHAKGGRQIGAFATSVDALKKAFELCPE